MNNQLECLLMAHRCPFDVVLYTSPSFNPELPDGR
jgi:hypothetical protein